MRSWQCVTRGGECGLSAGLATCMMHVSDAVTRAAPPPQRKSCVGHHSNKAFLLFLSWDMACFRPAQVAVVSSLVA